MKIMACIAAPLGALLMTSCSADAAGDDAAASEASAPAEAGETNPEATDAEIESARAFVDSIYGSYVDGSGVQDFSAVFIPEIAAHMGEDYGADPLCACQDFDAFSYAVTRLEAVDGGVEADVTFSNFGEENEISLRLVRIDGAWRVGDIARAGRRNLLDSLRLGS